MDPLAKLIGVYSGVQDLGFSPPEVYSVFKVDKD